MAWLVREGGVLASAEVADRPRARLVGLLGRDALDGVLVLHPARSVHTVGMRFPIDVVWCAPVAGTDGGARRRRFRSAPLDGVELVVVRTATVPPNRVTPPVRGASVVVETPVGAVERWALRPGDRVAVRA